MNTILKYALLMSAVSSVNAQIVSKPLSELGFTAPIRLQGVDARAVIKIPVSPRENIEAFKIVLDYANSTSLQEARSSLILRLNDQVLSQNALTTTGGNKTKELVIPRSALKVGYNELTVQAVQHYTYECEDQNSTELWTEINHNRSRLMANVTGLKYNNQPTLPQLGVVYDPRAWHPQTITVVAGSGYASDVALSAAALGAQGVALRKQGVPVFKWAQGDTAFSSAKSGQTLPGLNLDTTQGDVLLIGRKAEISRYLDSTTYQLINGPFLSLQPLAKDGRIATIISGETDEQVLEAAKVFADQDQVVPAEQNAVVKFNAWNTLKLIEPKRATTFADLGFRTATLQGLNPGSTSLKFIAPADYAARKGDMSTLKLHFAYAGGIRADSTLVMKLNGQFVSSVPLNNIEGQEFTKLDVSVPSEYVLPGQNVISFEPVFMTTKEKCGMIRDEHMHLTVYEDSTLELSKSNVVVSAPDLGRFGMAGWPYTQDSNQLFINVRDSRAFEGMLTFVAAHANQIQQPKLWQVSTTQPQKGDYFLLGEFGAMDNGVISQIKGAMPKGNQLHFAQVQLGSATTNPQVVTTLGTERLDNLTTLLTQFDKTGQWRSLNGTSSMYNAFDNSIQSIQAPKVEKVQSVFTLPDEITRWDYSSYLLWAVGAGLLLAFSVNFLTSKKQRDRDDQ